MTVKMWIGRRRSSGLVLVILGALLAVVGWLRWFNV